MAKEDRASIFDRFAPALLILSVALAFMVGVLWQKVANLEGGGVNTGGVVNNGGAAPEVPNGKLTDDQVKNIPEVSGDDHIRGSKDAEIILVEYSDLECPFCERFHPTAKQAFDEYGDKISWVYRQFPLTSIHPRALPAANASECVADLAGNDGFWKFIDMVFSNQEKYLTDGGLKEAAVASGAAAGAYDSCFSASKFADKITNEQSGGEKAGITGTPGTFVINKKGEAWLVPGAVGYDSLKATIEEALGN